MLRRYVDRKETLCEHLFTLVTPMRSARAHCCHIAPLLLVRRITQQLRPVAAVVGRENGSSKTQSAE